MKRKLLWAAAVLLSAAAAAFFLFHLNLPAPVPAIEVTEPNRAPSTVRMAVFDEPGEDRINVNTADSAELQQLPGIGPAIAERIITERETNGPFFYPQDLRSVNGIGEKTLNKIMDLICFE